MDDNEDRFEIRYVQNRYRVISDSHGIQASVATLEEARQEAAAHTRETAEPCSITICESAYETWWECPNQIDSGCPFWKDGWELLRSHDTLEAAQTHMNRWGCTDWEPTVWRARVSLPELPRLRLVGEEAP